MFKKVFSKLFPGKKEEPPAPASPEPRFKLTSPATEGSRQPAPVPAEKPPVTSGGTDKTRTAPIPGATNAAGPADAAKDAAAGKPKALLEWEAAAAKQIDKGAKAEELCGIKPDWSQQQIRDHLAMLYRRHNRAASSLDSKLREEAETMLDAIVRCREKLVK